jgi:uncharacterized protein (TIGR03437 family)
MRLQAKMRILSTAVLATLFSCVVLGQPYAVQTVAGGGLPENIPGVSANLSAVSAVATDPAGNVFIALQDYRVVLRLDSTTGLLVRVAGNGDYGYGIDNVQATQSRLFSPNALAVDNAGNLFIADSDRIRKVSHGLITTVAGGGSSLGENVAATSAQLCLPGGIAVDAAGNLFIADTCNNLVRKVSNGVITTVAGGGTSVGNNGPAANAQLYWPGGVAVDAAGDLFIADTFNNLVRKVSNGVITTVAGGGYLLGDNGSATNAELYEPKGLAVDAAGNLFIADTENERIRKVSNGVITTVAGGGSSIAGNGTATSVQLWLPQSIAVDSAGSLFIADTYNNRIRKVSNGVIATVAGGGSSVGDGGAATSAQLVLPESVAADSAGNFYIAEPRNNCIRKISNGVISTVAGNGTAGFSGDNGPASSAQLNLPQGIAVDSGGNLYIADTGNHRIRKVSNGAITTVAGNGVMGFGGDSSPAINAQLKFPGGIAVDPAGNLYIADTSNHRVRKVSNGIIATVAGNGTAGFSGDNGPAPSARLWFPEGVAVDSAGSVFIADSYNWRIRRVSNGVITTVAGGALPPPEGGYFSIGDNGPATNAVLYYPAGIAVDTWGNLYLNDIGAVRRVTNGIITTVAGGEFSFDASEEAVSAHLGDPTGLAVDPNNNLYIADDLYNLIHLLIPSRPTCTASVSSPTLEADASGGELVLAIQTSTSECAWAIQNLPPWIVAEADLAGAGPARISLKVEANTGGARTASISVASSLLQVTQTGVAASIHSGGVVNAASFAAGLPLAAGSIATAYGGFLLAAPSSAAGAPLPTSLSGLSLQFNGGVIAPLFYADAEQVNFQVPWELAGQTAASLAPVLNAQVGSGLTVTLAEFGPAIFTVSAQGAGQGAIVDNATSRLLDSSNPATAGSTVVQIYCTGLGRVAGQPATGDAAPSGASSETATTPTVTIGGAQATVLFSGLAPGFVGGYQINALVPAGASRGAAVPVVLSIGGVTSNTVTMAVQ